jgi:hypothetical protein
MEVRWSMPAAEDLGRVCERIDTKPSVQMDDTAEVVR